MYVRLALPSPILFTSCANEDLRSRLLANEGEADL
jgi:hypothetical protein